MRLVDPMDRVLAVAGPENEPDRFGRYLFRSFRLEFVGRVGVRERMVPLGAFPILYGALVAPRL